jgi:hypothetical protein
MIKTMVRTSKFRDIEGYKTVVLVADMHVYTYDAIRIPGGVGAVSCIRCKYYSMYYNVRQARYKYNVYIYIYTYIV